MRAALRHLCDRGVEALKPQKVLSKAAKEGTNTRAPEVWHRPVISKRVGNDLRKSALKDGTYGSFNIETGVGWEPAWDIVLKGNQFNVTRFGGIRPKKQHARQRNREERAKKLEENLETRLDKMEEHYVNKESLREVDESFEGRFKRMTKG
jgi:uncharacterized protein with von Willebrand factor type A (vWA) domain